MLRAKYEQKNDELDQFLIIDNPTAIRKFDNLLDEITNLRRNLNIEKT